MDFIKFTNKKKLINKLKTNMFYYQLENDIKYFNEKLGSNFNLNGEVEKYRNFFKNLGCNDKFGESMAKALSYFRTMVNFCFFNPDLTTYVYENCLLIRDVFMQSVFENIKFSDDICYEDYYNQTLFLEPDEDDNADMVSTIGFLALNLDDMLFALMGNDKNNLNKMYDDISVNGLIQQFDIFDI